MILSGNESLIEEEELKIDFGDKLGWLCSVISLYLHLLISQMLNIILILL